MPIAFETIPVPVSAISSGREDPPLGEMRVEVRSTNPFDVMRFE